MNRAERRRRQALERRGIYDDDDDLTLTEKGMEYFGNWSPTTLINTVAALSVKTGHSIEDVAEGIAALKAHGLIKDGRLAMPDDPAVLDQLPEDLRQQLEAITRGA